MQNFLQKGEALDLTAPSDLLSGQGVLFGSVFGVAGGAMSNGDVGPFYLEGVFLLPKAASQAWTVGALIYWDNTNSVCTTTSSGNTKIGVAVAAVDNGSGSTLGKVRLNGAY